MFTDYYRRLALFQSDDDFQSFMSALNTPLPIAWRVISDTPHAHWVNSLLEESKAGLQEAGQSDCLKELPFLEGAWQLTATRAQLRENPKLRSLKDFLLKQSENGVIVRQEVVSMIPAHLLIQLAVKSDAVAILDMCAAPGSKTSQFLEALRNARTDDMKNASIPERGVVVANDLNSTRAHMLVHHIKYQASPALLVTLHNAGIYPRVWKDQSFSSHFKFDGVLCDVPCTGDGTIRKMPSLLKKWNTGTAATLHPLQMKILKRGLLLCAIGGYVVYSTCSFNPLENEAVVAALLRIGKGSVELVDCGEILKSMKFRAGLDDWPVLKRGVEYKSYDDVPTGSAKKSILRSMFPPTEEDIKESLREKCMRFIPHDNDTGGFFVAVFKKLKDCPWSYKSAESSEDDDESSVPKEDHRLFVSQKDFMQIPAEKVESVTEQYLKPFGLERIVSTPDRLRLLRVRLGLNSESKIMSDDSPTEIDNQIGSTLPRKVALVSNRVAEILDGFCVRKPLRVLSAGMGVIEKRSTSPLRMLYAAYPVCLSMACPPGQAVVSLGPLVHYMEPKYFISILKAVQKKGETGSAPRLSWTDDQTSPLGDWLSSLAPSQNHVILTPRNPAADMPETESALREVALKGLEEKYIVSTLYRGKNHVEFLMSESIRESYKSFWDAPRAAAAVC